MSFRDVEDLLAERGVIVTYETIRQWWNKFGPGYANTLRKRAGRLGDAWLLDEVTIVMIGGDRRYLWRAVDQDSNVIDNLVQKRKDKGAANSPATTALRITNERLRAAQRFRILEERPAAIQPLFSLTWIGCFPNT